MKLYDLLEPSSALFATDIILTINCCYGFLETDAVDSDPNIRLIRVGMKGGERKMFYFKIVKKRLFPTSFPDYTYAPKTLPFACEIMITCC
jgi:hypothetical protein